MIHSFMLRKTLLSNHMMHDDGCEKAEAIGLLHQLKSFTFILLLWVFDDILVITKILSDTLQSKELDLARAMELVNSVRETLTE